jgi:hypothetical protein
MDNASTLRRGSVGRLLSAILCVLFASLAFAATGSAKTVELHLFDKSFTGSDAVGAGAFPSGSLEKLDVDKSNGTVYVGSNAGRIYKFDAEGVSQAFSGREGSTVLTTMINELGDLEVDNSGTATQGRFYTLPDYGPISAWEPSGLAPAEGSYPIDSGSEECGAAVDADGDLWRHVWNGNVAEFDDTGAATGSTVTINPSGFCDFDMDAAGNFYAPSSYGGGATSKYNSSGTLQYVVDNGNSIASAADYSNNDIYVNVRNKVNHYTSTGQLVESFGTAEGAYTGMSSSRGIAVNPVTHAVYVGSNGSPTRVDKFISTGVITIADVTTDPATELTRTSAKLNGTVNPDNVNTTNCKFEWGTTTAYSGGSVPCDQGHVFTGNSTTPVTAPLTGLLGGTTYHFRLAVTNAQGKSNGPDREFTTVSAVKDVVTLDPSNVTRTSATLRGSFDADGYATSYWFEWAQGCCGEVLSNKVPLPAPPGENVGTPVGTYEAAQNISGLTKNTTYRFRLVAKNELGETKGAIKTFTTVGNVKGVKPLPPTEISYQTATLHGELDPDGFATEYWFEWTSPGGFSFDNKSSVGNAGPAAGAIEVNTPITGLQPGTGYYFRFVAKNELGQTTGQPEFTFFETKQAVAGVTTAGATNVHLTSAALHGSLNPEGIATQYFFEYGTSTNYGQTSPVYPPGGEAGSGVGSTPFEATVTELEPGATYHYRMVGENLHGKSYGQDVTFLTNDKPTILNDTVSQVNTDGAILQAEINANALETTYHFEYGPEPCSISACTSTPTGMLFDNLVPKPVSIQRSGLTPGETVYFRVIAQNSRGSVTGEDRHFTTYVPDPGIDLCHNSQVRQQTTSALLLNCRAYELVSSAKAGGYDVESDLVAGQQPLVAYPDAQDRLLYSMHQGSIPGIAGNPTNFERDPYIATRGTDRWTTSYVGLPANGMTQVGAFASPLLGADSQLSVFAFGGKNICDPCFADGSTNIPLRLGDGSLVKGMAGSLNPAADPAQQVAKPLSANGEHLIFGSNAKFEGNGDAAGSIYDRNLTTGATQVVSTTTGGTAMTGGGVGELDISSDGSRIVIGKKVSTDAKGNDYWHPYMHIGTTAASVDLAPTSTTGVLFAGMTSDGSKVFFTSKDKLTGSDTDESADLYQAAVAGAGPAVLTQLSTGAPPPVGNSNACDPAANSDGNNWNAVGGASTDSCGVVAIAGGGGVAGEDGSVYFLSPEQLDGNGTQDEPNLFVASQGQAPHFIATLEEDNPAVRNGVADSEMHRYGDFQVTPDGNFAVFNSNISLTPFNSLGHTQIYRYSQGDDEVVCASCAPSGAAPITDTSLPDFGLGIADSGNVFFTSAESFVLRDTNEVKDAYEYEKGVVQLISTGASLEDSGMLSVSSDGQDAFFFTREVLVNEDGNGSTVKIYDARRDGGFLYDPPPHPCAASDECHGAGTESPGPPNINTFTGAGHGSEAPSGNNACKKGFVKRKGKCVKKKKKKRKHHKRKSSHRNG